MTTTTTPPSSSSPPPPSTAAPAAAKAASPGPVDRRIYDQLVAAQGKAAARLSARTRALAAARKEASARGVALGEAASALADAVSDLRACASAAQTGASVTAFAVSAADGSARLAALAAKLEAAAVKIEAAAATAKAVAPVPISLTLEAVGTYVTLHGSWDGWAEEGIPLAPVGPGSGAGPATFLAHFALPPGRYVAKLRIDGAHWRLVPGWETVTGDDGVENSVLRVE